MQVRPLPGPKPGSNFLFLFFSFIACFPAIIISFHLVRKVFTRKRRSVADDRQFRLFDASLRPTRHLYGASPERFCNLQNIRIYIASRTIHASKWRKLRESGLPIFSTWIDEADAGQSKCLSSLATRCIEEARSSTHLILYCEEGEHLKGALLECGAALANNIPVYCVGNCASISRVFENHPCWRSFNDVEEVLNSIIPSPTAFPLAGLFEIDQ